MAKKRAGTTAEASNPVSTPSEPRSSGKKKDIRVRNGKPYEYRHTKKDTALSPAHMDPLWQAMDATIGGKEGLLAAAMASSNPKAAMLVPMILDPAYKQWGTKALARKAGASASEVVDMFRDQKWLEAILAVHENLPDVVRDTVTDARASRVPCDLCKTKKVLEDGSGCYACGGKGYLRKPGDKDKLKFIGESAGLLKGNTQNIQTNLQLNIQQPAGTSFEDMVRKAAAKPKLIEVTKSKDIKE